MSETPEQHSTAKLNFDKVVLQWWSHLQQERGARAALRHCHTPVEVVLEEPFQLLHQRLSRTAPIYIERLAIIAGVVAHIDINDVSMSFATQLGLGDGKARLSGLRFRRLLVLNEADGQMLGLIRAVRLLDRRAHVVDLARSIRYWGESIKQRWAMDYYRVAMHQS